MIIHDVGQRTPEWHALRLGKVTGSVAADMLATVKTKGAEAASRRNLRVRLVLERLTGRSQESGYQNQAMLDGIEREPDACALYEALTGRLLESSGFISHDSLAAGVSLDGYVNNYEGIVEVKSPIAVTHLDYLKSGIVPDNYLAQIRHGLWMTGAQWCDWLSYHPDFPEPLQVKLVRIERVQIEVDAYELMLRQFLREVDEEYAVVSRMAMVAA